MAMKNIRLSIEYIRVLPFIGVEFSVLHMFMLLLSGNVGYDVRPEYINTWIYILSFAVEKIWSVFLLAGFLVVSKSFGFCRLHRLAIIELFFTYSCYDYQRLIGFGRAITVVRVILLLLGIAIIARFLTRNRCNKETRGDA